MSAVVFDDVSFHYGLGRKTIPVLDGLSIDVAAGTIYGLLGPSGCGKTTLLSCCLGALTPKSGSILLYGEKPHSKGLGVPGPLVGYMPQYHTLHRFFTPREILTYYGWVFQVSNLGPKISSLLDMLQLSDQQLQNRLVTKLSGGQRRRLSLACAMIHSPKILILDEPTVGVDPVLRQTIWSFLVECAAGGTTVIITTHFMEEADKANKIGFMRGGTILVEGSPTQLKEKFAQPTLDAVFLQLCEEDEKNEGDDENFGLARGEKISCCGRSKPAAAAAPRSEEEAPLEAKRYEFASVKKQTISVAAAASALIYKDLCIKKRNRIITLFASIFPVFIFLTFLGSIGQPIRDLRVAIVNEECDCSLGYSNLTCPQISSLLENDFSLGSNLSCHIVDSLDPFVFGTVTPRTLEEAVESVTMGVDVAYLRVESGFSEALSRRLSVMATLDDKHLEEEDIGISQLKVNMDATNIQIVQSLKLHLMISIRDFLVEFADSCDLGAVSDSLFTLGLDFKNVAEGQEQTSWNLSHTMMPGIISMVLMLLALALTADQLVGEKDDGLLTRDYICGVTIPVYLAAQMVVHCSVVAVQIAASLVFLKVLFITLPWLILFFFIPFLFTQSLCGMSMGLAITVIGKNKDQEYYP